MSSKTCKNWALWTCVAATSLGKVEKRATHGIERCRLSRKIVGVLERNDLYFAAGPVAIVPQSHHSQPDRTPLDILRERFARGEIDKEEFEEPRRILAD